MSTLNIFSIKLIFKKIKMYAVGIDLQPRVFACCSNMPTLLEDVKQNRNEKGSF